MPSPSYIKSRFHIAVSTPHQPYTLNSHTTTDQAAQFINTNCFSSVLHCIVFVYILWLCCKVAVAAAYAYTDYVKRMYSVHPISLSYNTIIAAKLQKNVIGECSHTRATVCIVWVKVAHTFRTQLQYKRIGFTHCSQHVITIHI